MSDNTVLRVLAATVTSLVVMFGVLVGFVAVAGADIGFPELLIFAVLTVGIVTWRAMRAARRPSPARAT